MGGTLCVIMCEQFHVVVSMLYALLVNIKYWELNPGVLHSIEAIEL